MKYPNAHRFAPLMAGLCELYSKPLTESLTEIYWQALQHFDIEDIQRAVYALIHHPDMGQFMPKPADIIRYLQGSSQTQGLQAWSKVEKAMRQVGAYDSIVFDDAIIHIVILEMGGWIALCRTTLQELPFKAQEFNQRYQGYVLHPPTEYPRQLTGITEHHNRQGNNRIPLPTLFGDKALALAIYHQGHAPKPLFDATPLKQSSDKAPDK